MHPSTRAALALCSLVAIACGDEGGGADESGSQTDASATGDESTLSGATMPGTSSTSTTTTGADGSTSGSESGGGIVPDPDMGMGAPECDVWAQDCPEGEKCMPYANDGGNAWNATKCVPVEGRGQVGDPCTVVGMAVSGMDDCAAGLMCYNVQIDTGMGVCYELCGGTPDAPVCEAEGTICANYNDGVLPLCLNECDPTIQDCPGGVDLCLDSPGGDSFVCILDALPGADGSWGTACNFYNSCDAGLFCAVPTVVAGCVDAGCCAEFCDTTMMNPNDQCTGAPMGEECLDWWNGNPPPPGYEHVGYCGLP
jgi:hypothetical protein